MISIIGWIAALATLLTSVAMLNDSMLRTPRTASWIARWRHMLRLRVVALIAIAASSGVCVFFPGHHGGGYDVLLRCALTAMLLLQTPCPWWRYITRGSGSTPTENLHDHTHR